MRVTRKALQLFFYFFFSFSSVFLDGLAKAVCVFFFYCCLRHVRRPISDIANMIWRVLFCHVIEKYEGFKGACEILFFNYQKHFISTITVLLATSLGRMVTYQEGLLLIKPDEHFNKWLREVTLKLNSQVKSIKYH